MRLNWFLVIVLLLISVFALSVSVFAKSVTDYQYNKIMSSYFDVHFENLSNVLLENTAKELVKPTISKRTTEISSFRVQFNSKDDTASYTFDAVNAGSIDAVISSITLSDPICYGLDGNNLEDAYRTCDNFSYTITYLDGSEIKVGDTLTRKSSKTLKLTLRYSDNYWPTGTVDIQSISAKVNFIQK